MMTNKNPRSGELAGAYQLCSFVEASYAIKVTQVNSKTPCIEIVAKIELRTHTSAKPVFELGVDWSRLEGDPDLLNLRANGTPTHCEAATFNGDGHVPLIALSESLPPGLHTIELNYNLNDMVRAKQAISVNTAGLSLRFVMSDLDDRGSQFLGQYLPSNLGFDRYKMKFSVSVASRKTPYTLITNEGELPCIDGKYQWHYKTPEYFKASYIWFHLYPSDTHVIHKKQIVIGSNTIQATIYGSLKEFEISSVSTHAQIRISRLLALYMKRSIRYLRYFIHRYGEFPTQYLTVLMRAPPTTGDNDEKKFDPVNMEFAGAISARPGYLKHEICHCYFGRCVSPANGDAGWFDEAVASWEDLNTPSLEQSPQYLRGFLAKSDLDRRMHAEEVAGELVAYTEGQAVIGHLDYLLRAQGGMKGFLRYLLSKKKWMPVTNQDLTDLLNEFAPDLQAGNTFIRYVNGRPRYAPLRH